MKRDIIFKGDAEAPANNNLRAGGKRLGISIERRQT